MIRVCRCAFYAFLARHQDARGELEVGPGLAWARFASREGVELARITRSPDGAVMYEVSPAAAGVVQL